MKKEADPAATAQRGQPSVFGRFTRIRKVVLARPAWLIFGRSAKKMTPPEILEALIGIRPDFRAYWDDDGNLFRDEDGTFTGCGVFTEFGHFFQEQHTKMKKEELIALGAFIALAESDDFLADAAYTCFLENIAGDPPDDTLAPYLSPAATKFIDGWRPRKKRPIQPPQTTTGSEAPGRV